MVIRGIKLTGKQPEAIELPLLLLSQLFKPLLGRTRSRARCWAAVRMSHCPEPSGHAVNWERRWIGHWRTTWSTVCSSAPHSHAAKEVIPHLYRQERKRPTPVRRPLSRTQGSGCRCRRWKCGVQPLRIPLVIRPLRRTYVFIVRWSDEMLCGGYKRVSRFGTLCICTRWTNERWVEQMSRFHGTRAGDSVAPLWRSSAGWMPVRTGRLSAGVGRRHPVTIRKAWLMTGLMRRVWAPRHQTGGRYSAV